MATAQRRVGDATARCINCSLVLVSAAYGMTLWPVTSMGAYLIDAMAAMIFI